MKLQVHVCQRTFQKRFKNFLSLFSVKLNSLKFDIYKTREDYKNKMGKNKAHTHSLSGVFKVTHFQHNVCALIVLTVSVPHQSKLTFSCQV